MADLSGRDLDAAVARVLWLGGDIHHPEHPAYGRAYSTDYALLGEMLSWLRSRLRPGHELSCEDDGSVWVTATYTADGYGRDYFQTAKGATLPEAVARLVVAVGAKGEQS